MRVCVPALSGNRKYRKPGGVKKPGKKPLPRERKMIHQQRRAYLSGCVCARGGMGWGGGPLPPPPPPGAEGGTAPVRE